MPVRIRIGYRGFLGGFGAATGGRAWTGKETPNRAAFRGRRFFDIKKDSLEYKLLETGKGEDCSYEF